MEWPTIIDDQILKNILLYKSELDKKFRDSKIYIKTSYNSLLVTYPKKIEKSSKVLELKNIYIKIKKISNRNFNRWEIPVCYDDSYAIDLDEYSKKISMSKNEIVSLHSNKTYYLHMYGFIPGFMYLGGLDKKLFIQRKDKPSRNILKGSVAIGGSQTGIYPSNSPGGWYVIGNSPLNFFDIGKKESPVIVPAGDYVKFLPISESEFKKIEVLSKEGKYSPNKTFYND